MKLSKRLENLEAYYTTKKNIAKFSDENLTIALVLIARLSLVGEAPKEDNEKFNGMISAFATEFMDRNINEYFGNN